MSATASSARHGNCAECGKHDYCLPLHGERGGPLVCLLCAGKWQAKHGRRRRAGRVAIKALRAYEAAGGNLFGMDFDALRLEAAGGISFQIDGDGEVCFSRLTDSADSAESGELTTELLTTTLALTHPDKHPAERKAEANRVTQELLELRPFVFPAPPKPKPHDASVNANAQSFKEPSREPPYPCEDCRYTVSRYYCTACRAQWDKVQREREDKQRKRTNERQRKRYKRHSQMRRGFFKSCAACGTGFNYKRADAQYCSAACRQRAYVKRG